MSLSFGNQTLGDVRPILSGEELYRMGLSASLGEEENGVDLVAAHMWFNLAAMQGHMEARAYRKELAFEMTAEEVAEAQRKAREYLLTSGMRASA